jgi:hypothetical protein
MKTETNCSQCGEKTTDYCGVSGKCHDCCLRAAIKSPGSKVYGLTFEQAKELENE